MNLMKSSLRARGLTLFPRFLIATCTAEWLVNSGNKNVHRNIAGNPEIYTKTNSPVVRKSAKIF